MDCKITISLITLRTIQRNQFQAGEIIRKAKLMRYVVQVAILKFYSIFYLVVTNLAQIFAPDCLDSCEDLQ